MQCGEEGGRMRGGEGREGGREGGNREEEKVGGRDGYRWIERGRMEEERESHNK